MTDNLSFNWGKGISLKNTDIGNNYYANLYCKNDGALGLTNFYLESEGNNVSRTLATREWFNNNYLRFSVFTTTIAYSSGYHKDINVTQLSGKSSVLGIISVNAFGTRRNASFGVVSATSTAYTISVTIYNAEGGGGAPAGIDNTSVQIWYYY